MNGTNVVFLNGTVVADPELKVFEQSGNRVATLRLATNETYMKDGEKVQTAQYHTVKFWSKLADTVANYVKKGSNINVIGKLTYRDYTDPQGNKRTFAEVHAVSPNSFSFLPNNTGGASQNNNESAPQQPRQTQQQVGQPQASGTDVQSYVNSTSQATNADFVGADDEDDLPF